MKVFLSGIIQGSHSGTELHDQGYRDELKRLLSQHLPEAEVVCPIDLHPNGIEYDLGQAREAFFSLVEEAASADLVVAYLPEASMGTAIEIWEAHRRGTPVLAITPLRHNWVVNLLAGRAFASVAEFAAFAAEGGLRELVE
ncbi:MAG: nucleoside 2-deoxyribosyltransferase [Chloroflexi bacterium]|nr:nucleoside 2-deoxyribosyltransferase [Chloroflexota bacterium]